MSIPSSSDRPWEGTHVVSPELASQLIEAQFPELLPLSMRGFGSGWDNTAYLVNDAILFRFPRREVGVVAMETEIRLLPHLQELPLSVPCPSYLGEPSALFPWPWAGYSLLKGDPIYRLPLGEGDRSSLAAPMGRFVRALHATVIPEEAQAPDDVWGRFDLKKRIPQIEGYLGKLKSIGVLDHLAGFERIIQAVEGTTLPGERVVAHGDLDGRHWIMDGGQVTGVIDWGDLHVGYPAVDLLVPWTFLHPDARADFWEAYGSDSNALRRWSRFRALNQSVVTTVYGLDINDTPLVREGLGALERLRIG